MDDLKPCPFCGGGADTVRMIPTGWNIKINHSDDCAIAQMSGVRCPDDSARDQFIAAWSNRPTPNDEGKA